MRGEGMSVCDWMWVRVCQCVSGCGYVSTCVRGYEYVSVWLGKVDVVMLVWAWRHSDHQGFTQD